MITDDLDYDYDPPLPEIRMMTDDEAVTEYGASVSPALHNLGSFGVRIVDGFPEPLYRHSDIIGIWTNNE